MTVAFAVIFMADIDKQLQTSYKPTETISLGKIHWWHFCVWTIPETEINNFIEFANSFRATFRFKNEQLSKKKVVSLDTEVF